ncbi:HU family DNA-binding protein [Peterkaempfera sp. SMS 1(5)a]|uniref:HU family DNA-binding protein n=1 Tax=Peterkaempfera podocarpi TaxID=3232308 RepID=UPI003672964D
MNKAQLVEAVAEQLGGRRAAAEAVDAVLDTIVRAVVAGDRVSVTGFGTFEKVDRSARFARNPQTGEKVKVKKTSVPRFRPGQGFKDLVSGSKKLPKEGPSVKKAPKGSLTPGKAGTTAAVKRAAAKRTAAAAGAAEAPAAARPVKRAAAKKAAPAAAAAKKTTATPTKKATAAKKTAVKKAAAAAKKTTSAAKKTAAAAKKTVAKKTTAKKTAPAAKKTSSARKSAARKAVTRKVAASSG